eukprot:664185_1
MNTYSALWFNTHNMLHQVQHKHTFSTILHSNTNKYDVDININCFWIFSRLLMHNAQPTRCVVCLFQYNNKTHICGRKQYNKKNRFNQHWAQIIEHRRCATEANG